MALRGAADCVGVAPVGAVVLAVLTVGVVLDVVIVWDDGGGVFWVAPVVGDCVLQATSSSESSVVMATWIVNVDMCLYIAMALFPLRKNFL
jgi:hypothetical protein